MKGKIKELDIKISVPDKIEDCNIEQISKFIQIVKEYNIKTGEEILRNFPVILEVVHIFSGVHRNRLRMVPIVEINKFFLHLLQMVKIEQKEEPDGVVEIEGKKYIFNLDFRKISTGQIIDIKMLDKPYKKPARLMAILYIEEGMTYHQSDESGHVLNPTDEREELFKKHFPVTEFLSCMDFFLRTYENTNLLIVQNNLIKTLKQAKKILKKMEKEKKKTISNGTNGRKQFSKWRKLREEHRNKLQKDHM